jgi:hypothetical protein
VQYISNCSIGHFMVRSKLASFSTIIGWFPMTLSMNPEQKRQICYDSN